MIDIDSAIAKDRGFTLLEVVIAMGITLFLALAALSMIATQNKALTHFKIRAEMLTLMVAATVSGNACTSVTVSGGTPPLGVCGSPNTPQTINVLYADSTRVDAGSDYLLQGACKAGYYALQVKAALATKIDPFNNQAIGAAYFEPAKIRFASQAWIGCP